LKKLVDDPQHVVREMLEGLRDLRHHLALLQSETVVVRADLPPPADCPVTILSGGSALRQRRIGCVAGGDAAPLPGLVATDPAVQPVEVAPSIGLVEGHDQQLVEASAEAPRRAIRLPVQCAKVTGRTAFSASAWARLWPIMAQPGHPDRWRELECTLSDRTLGWGGRLLGDELTRESMRKPLWGWISL
jgi:hypothetical protein